MGSLDFSKKPTSENDWWELFKTIGQSLHGVQKELEGIRGMKASVDSMKEKFTDQWKQDVENKLQVFDVCDGDNNFRLRLLTDVVIKQDAIIKELEKKIDRINARETKCNLIVKGIMENRDETGAKLVEVMQKFFKEKLQIEQEIEMQDVYRIGQRGIYDRPVLVKLRHYTDKANIFSHASNLKGIKNARRQLFVIQDNRDEHQNEIRNYYRDLLRQNNNLEEEEKKKMAISRKGITINNSVLREKVKVPKYREVLKMNAEEMEKCWQQNCMKVMITSKKARNFFKESRQWRTLTKGTRK